MNSWASNGNKFHSKGQTTIVYPGSHSFAFGPNGLYIYWGADKFLAWPTSRYILFDGENISFDASLVIYINSQLW